LGTRLRPLTEHLPKPLVPVWDQPLIAHAFDHLESVGAREFIVNTHWRAEAYQAAFPDRAWHGAPITLCHEPVLLETAGGIANAAPHFRRDHSFWVYNGDILCTVDLGRALLVHKASEALCTLVLRSHGPECVVAVDASTNEVRDIRNLLGTGRSLTHQFTGIYLCRPDFLDWLTPGKIESSRTVFVEMIRAGEKVSGVVLDQGLWLDLGDRRSYLAAHAALRPDRNLPVFPGVEQRGVCALSSGATIDPGAVLEDCVVWAGARVLSDARLSRCVVRTGQLASGPAADHDF